MDEKGIIDITKNEVVVIPPVIDDWEDDDFTLEEPDSAEDKKKINLEKEVEYTEYEEQKQEEDRDTTFKTFKKKQYKHEKEVATKIYKKSKLRITPLLKFCIGIFLMFCVISIAPVIIAIIPTSLFGLVVVLSIIFNTVSLTQMSSVMVIAIISIILLIIGSVLFSVLIFYKMATWVMKMLRTRRGE
ncbi:MAG: hypothetical protein BEN19_00235 [Epulopiscium sp. Nuni2H_MBin003]|nr:MAG: hypothetical protein BEN19_00235 [Epulopiscium sp. Nuni2H_MBin003]